MAKAARIVYQTRIISTGHRLAEVQITNERRTRYGSLVTVTRLRDAGADPYGNFKDIDWNYSRRGDWADVLLSIVDARTVRDASIIAKAEEASK